MIDFSSPLIQINKQGNVVTNIPRHTSCRHWRYKTQSPENMTRAITPKVKWERFWFLNSIKAFISSIHVPNLMNLCRKISEQSCPLWKYNAQSPENTTRATTLKINCWQIWFSNLINRLIPLSTLSNLVIVAIIVFEKTCPLYLGRTEERTDGRTALKPISPFHFVAGDNKLEKASKEKL